MGDKIIGKVLGEISLKDMPFDCKIVFPQGMIIGKQVQNLVSLHCGFESSLNISEPLLCALVLY